MNSEASSLDTLNDIKKMMEKSSRFISLSGWSGISAGISGLLGAFFANRAIGQATGQEYEMAETGLLERLIIIATATFVVAFTSAVFFTYRRSLEERIPIWGRPAQRLLFNTMLPMIVGGIVILRILAIHEYSLIVPCALVFYGLALVHGSKYTLGEIRYLGYIQLVLGILNLWFPEQWLFFWMAGFGFMHIIYGVMMWWRYERS